MGSNISGGLGGSTSAAGTSFAQGIPVSGQVPVSGGVAPRGGAGLPAGTKRVLVLGASRSGMSAALALTGLGLHVTLSDREPSETLPGVAKAVSAGVEFVGEDQLIASAPSPDLVIKSPGVPGEAGPVMAMRERGIPIWSEVELAYALFSNPFDAITGTNGKTTTTALLGHLFDTAGRPNRVLGNIGVAITSVAGQIEPDEELVIEVSSFQLEDIHSFRPAVGIFLNLTPDHLDRHGSLERYLACKANLFANQGQTDVAVMNLGDRAVAELGESLLSRDEGPRVAFFSLDAMPRWEHATVSSPSYPHPDSWVEDGLIFLQGRPVVSVDEIQLPGLHNLENCLAAGTAAIARGLTPDAVAEGLRTFKGVAHRLERAGIIAGVTYVNDSKATNVEATLTALNAYSQRVHLILGGRDKASDYRPLALACARACAGVYLIGEAASLIKAAFTEVRAAGVVEGVPEPRECGDLETAVRAAAGRALPGDVVLLAPACASFDQYRSFEERGEHFRTIVSDLNRQAP